MSEPPPHVRGVRDAGIRPAVHDGRDGEEVAAGPDHRLVGGGRDLVVRAALRRDRERGADAEVGQPPGLPQIRDLTLGLDELHPLRHAGRVDQRGPGQGRRQPLVHVDGQPRRPRHPLLDADPTAGDPGLAQHPGQHAGRILVRGHADDPLRPGGQAGARLVDAGHDQRRLAAERRHHALVVVDVEVLVAGEVEDARRMVDEHRVEPCLAHHVPQTGQARAVLRLGKGRLLHDARDRGHQVHGPAPRSGDGPVGRVAAPRSEVYLKPSGTLCLTASDFRRPFDSDSVMKALMASFSSGVSLRTSIPRSDLLMMGPGMIWMPAFFSIRS